jgi:hypothetical protein
MKIKRILIVTLIVIASPVLLFWLWCTAGMTADKYFVADYLGKKYGKEFVVNEVVYHHSSGEGLYLNGIAHPKDDSSLKFNIVRYSGRGGRKHQLYKEIPSYRSSLWAKQKREEIKAILRNDLVLAGISVSFSDEELYGRTISVKDAERKFKKEMLLFITYGLWIDFKDFNSRTDKFNNFMKGSLSREQAENLYNIIKKLKNQNYTTIELKIRYFDSRYKKKINEKPEWYLYGVVSNSKESSGFEEGMVLCSFEMDDINQINRPEDVKRFIDLEAGYLYYADSKDQNDR